MIGDPSGKSQERNLLDEKTLRHNQEAIKRQLAKLLDFESDAPNAAVMVNNYDWMKEFSFLDFIRDIGKCITVNYMMAKDSVKKRFNGEGDGMSFTEFTYQLVQGYDFLHLYQAMNCKIQLGGADQWGNITTGTELIRRKLGPEAEAFAITCPSLPRPTAPSSARPRAATCGSTRAIRRLTSSTSSGSTSATRTPSAISDFHPPGPRNHRNAYRRARCRAPSATRCRSGWRRRLPR